MTKKEVIELGKEIQGAVELLERSADEGKLIDVSKDIGGLFDLNNEQWSYVKKLCEKDGYKISTVFINKIGEEGVKIAVPVMHSADKDQKYVVEHKSEISIVQPKTAKDPYFTRRMQLKIKALHRNNLLKVILKLSDRGASNTEIAKQLDIAESTVRNLKKNKDLIEEQANAY